MYLSNDRSIIATQHAFKNHFNIAPVDRVPDWKPIDLWVDSFRETDDVQEKNPGGSKTIRKPEKSNRLGSQFYDLGDLRVNMQLLLEYLTVVWDEFLTKNCNFIYTNWQWYKNLVHEIFFYAKMHAKLFFTTCLMMHLCSSVMRLIFIFLVAWIDKTYDTRVTRIPKNFMSSPCKQNMWLFGVHCS